MNTLESLRAKLDEARLARNLNPCPETLEAYRQAWVAFDQVSTPIKPSGRAASKAGKRQAAERRALHRRIR